jgi:preprotein translocase subunit SecY
MSFFKNIIYNLPEVAKPQQRKLSFKEKLKWTLLILVIFYVLGSIPLFGLDPQNEFRFEQLEIILGASFGSIITLGIGPIVTASIVLQLLNGSGLIKMDLTSHEGKRTFQGVQKLLAIVFIIFEAFVFVYMGGLSPTADLAGTPMYMQLQLLLVFQLFLGGILILFMDDVINKWGFGQGISLFIVAGVGKQLFIRALSPFDSAGNLMWSAAAQEPVGRVWALFTSLAGGDPISAGLALAAILATVVVFAIAVFAQSMKVEIPLSFGRVRGHGIRWPLNFIYTSVIPVILISALMANIQLWARLMQNWGRPLLGTFVGNTPVSGLVLWLNPPDIVGSIIRGTMSWSVGAQAIIYLLILMAGAAVFSIFWMQTSGMDARSQANQMMSSGLQIPGFRRDQRVLERLLNRYIWPLTVMGGLAIGFLAGIADLTGALARGTGILLAVMIVFKLYEEIAKQHMYDMNPMMRKFMGGE